MNRFKLGQQVEVTSFPGSQLLAAEDVLHKTGTVEHIFTRLILVSFPGIEGSHPFLAHEIRPVALVPA